MIKVITETDINTTLNIESNKLGLSLSNDSDNILGLDSNGKLLSERVPNYNGLLRNGSLDESLNYNFTVSSRHFELTKDYAQLFGSLNVMKTNSYRIFRSIDKIHIPKNTNLRFSYQIYIPIDHVKDYCREYAFVDYYDDVENVILSRDINAYSDKMTLTQDVSVGDTIIHVDNNLLTSSGNINRQELKFDYENNGVDYSHSFYSRKLSRGNGSRNIDFANSTSTEIHLKNTCVVSALAGTRVWQSDASGGTYNYGTPTIVAADGLPLNGSYIRPDRFDIVRGDYGRLINVSIETNGFHEWVRNKVSTVARYMKVGILPQFRTSLRDGPLNVSYRSNFALDIIE